MIKNKGFTLIEMMVVVAIIAILSGSFLIGLRGFRSSAYDARRLSDLQKIQGSLELYYNKYGIYPNASQNWSALESALQMTGLTKLPNDPQFSAGVTDNYNYDVSSNGQDYILRATLSDVDNKALDEDIDVAPSGMSIDCSDTTAKPYYCIAP